MDTKNKKKQKSSLKDSRRNQLSSKKKTVRVRELKAQTFPIPAEFINQKFVVYKKRWVILILFALYSGSNALQWIQYTIIYNIVKKYYNVSAYWIDWTSMIYMVVYIPLVFPGSWFLDKFGLRTTAVVGTLGTCIAAWIKVVSVRPDLFYVGFIGQIVVALSQVFVLSLPSRIAAVWFGYTEISTACCIGVFGNEMGVAIGFLLPPLIVKNSDNLEQIGNELRIMFYSIAAYTTLLSILIIIFFNEHPPTPPSIAAALKLKEFTTLNFRKSIVRLLTNLNFVLLLIAYGLNVGVLYAISTYLNPVVLRHFPGHEEDAGRIGLCIIVFGMVSSIICGIILDKTHRFKEIAVVTYFFSFVILLILSYVLSLANIVITYITASSLGIFMSGYLFIGFEFSVELTYPEPEGTSVGMINASAQLFGVLLTNIFSMIFNKYDDFTANIVMSTVIFVGFVITAFIKADLRRRTTSLSYEAQQ